MRTTSVLSVAALSAFAPNAHGFVAPKTFGAMKIEPRASTAVSPSSLEAAIYPPSENENVFQPLMDLISAPFGKTTAKDAVVIDPDYSLSLLFVSAAGMIYLFYPDKTVCDPNDFSHICAPSFIPGVLAFLHLWFGVFLADRSSRIRCAFHKDRFEMFDIHDKLGNLKEEMSLREKNYVVGGNNSWKYDSFVNVDFFPSVNVPILCYFKETQTPKGKWVVGPGKYDHRNNGMVHFFPAFCNARQLKREWEARGCKKIQE